MKIIFEQRGRIIERLENKLKNPPENTGDMDYTVRTAAYEKISELLKKMDKPAENFDEDLWGAFIDHITVYSNGNKEIFLKDDTSFILGFRE